MKLTYLLLFPVSKSLSSGGQVRQETIKRAPYFLDIDIDIREIESGSEEISNHKVETKSYIYDGAVRIFECSYDLGVGITKDSSSLKDKINKEIRKRIVEKYKPNAKLVEEYTILQISEVDKIKEFVEKNKFLLARLVRSVDKKIGDTEADEILVSQVSYSNEDMAFIDWEGAIVIDKDKDFESQVELLKIGNYQLLRYRILDQLIEKNLKDIRTSVEGGNKRILDNSFLRTVVKNRLSILLDFDSVDQSLLLVGDWYSAKFYKAVMQEFYLDDWKNLVKDKIDNLEALDSTIRDNLVFSWRRILDIVQVVGWLVLLVGYFLLYLKDARIF